MAKLNAQLDADRAGAKTADAIQDVKPARTFAGISQVWINGGHFQTDVCANRQSKYRGCVKRIVERWPYEDLMTITKSDLEDFVNSRTEGMREEYKQTLSLLYQEAIGQHWPVQNLAKMIRYSGQKRIVRTDLWDLEDRDKMIAAAEGLKLFGMAGLIRIGWLVGHRLADLLGARHRIHYRYGEFDYFAAKQLAAGHENSVVVPISDEDADFIQSLRSAEHDYLFSDSWTGKPYTMAVFQDHFELVRRKAQEEGVDKHLLYKDLRKSLVVRLATQKTDLLAICNITGHAPQTAARIMKFYFRPTSKVSYNTMLKDYTARGGRRQDFRSGKRVVEDWAPKPPRKVFKLTPAGPDARLALSGLVAELA